MAEVVVVGSCMIDLISYVPRLPKPGETIHGTKFSQGFGGKGANQCVMAARLGAKTAMVARVGDDTFGHSTLKNFEDNKVEVCTLLPSLKGQPLNNRTKRTAMVKLTNAASGVASIVVNDQGENAIVIVSGANSHLKPSDVQASEKLLSNSKVVICQLEIPPETTLEALKLARKHSVLTILNAAPGEKLSEEFYKNTDILCVNETEAEILSGLPVTDIEQAISAIRALLKKGPRCVVLTMGEKGVLFLDEQNGSSSIPYHIKAPKVNVVDTTGAGDAFVGALAYYLACDSTVMKNFPEAVYRSVIIASNTVTLSGTQTSFVTSSLEPWLLDSLDTRNASSSSTESVISSTTTLISYPVA